MLKRVLVDGGYIESSTYHYYLTDHLGNNRVVANASGTPIQKNHYYPFGMAFAENTTAEQSKQPYKYNGKELDQMHGLNLYDYSARYYEPAIGRFTTVDPLAEKYYSISPYAYCANNPLRYIDPTGMWVVGTDGKPVTYSAENGWSENASDDIKRIGNAMMKTETGTNQLNMMLDLNNETEISMFVSSEIKIVWGGLVLGETDIDPESISIKDDKIEKVGKANMTVYEGSIDLLNTKKGKKEFPEAAEEFKGLKKEELIGVIGGHESVHPTKKNIQKNWDALISKKSRQEAGKISEQDPVNTHRQIIKEIKEKKKK